MTGRLRPTDRLAAVFVLPYVLLGLFWVFANPAGAAPDETDHLVKALGMARVDIGAPLSTGPISDNRVDVRNASISRVGEIPARLDPEGYRCFAFEPAVTAACQPQGPAQTSGDVAATTTLGAYPPFLYPPVGVVASLGNDPPSAFRLGRVVVLAASALLLWLASAHLVRWLGPRSLVGLALLLTPMAVFCMGILNTSGIEILGAAGMVAVVAAYRLRPESLAATRTQLVVLVCGTALVLSRQLGVVTMAVLTLLLLVLGGWREVWTGLRDRRWVTWAAVVLPGLSTVAVGLWELRYDHPALLGPWLSVDSLRRVPEQSLLLLQESMGWFGWLDVRPPLWVGLVWFAGVVALVATALAVGDRRDRLVIVGMLVVAVLVSYVTYSRVFFGIDAGLQGRHVLPIFALVPIWSGAVVAERLPAQVLRRAVGVVSVALPLVVLYGLWLNSVRYAVGLGTAGSLWFVADAQWSPPLGWYPWLLLGVAGGVALGASWVRVLGDRSARPTTAGPREQ